MELKIKDKMTSGSIYTVQVWGRKAKIMGSTYILWLAW